MDLLRHKWHRYHYKNLSYLCLSFAIGLFLINYQDFRHFLEMLGNLGYIGAFIGGALFVSTFTVSIGAVILLFLSEYLNPLEIGIIAGAGAVMMDLAIFQFIQNKGLASEIKHFFEYFGGDKLSHLLHSKYFSWSLPVVGAIIIASPLPDELGVGLMGISKMTTYKFILLSFVLNSLGILIVVLTGLKLRP